MLDNLFPDGKRMNESEIMATIVACKIFAPYIVPEFLIQENQVWKEDQKEKFIALVVAQAERAEKQLAERLNKEDMYVIKNCETGIFILDQKEAAAACC